MDQKILKVGSSISVVLPAKDAREEGFFAGDIISVTREAGRFIVEKKAPAAKKSAGNAKLVAWAEEAVERYRPALEALKDK
ncbi:MAG TPA: hypothetical protein VIJ88_03380 [Candidatus Paceibacterota bacterium]